MINELERPRVLLPLPSSRWQDGWTLYWGGALFATADQPLTAAYHLQGLFGDECQNQIVVYDDEMGVQLSEALDQPDRAKIVAGYLDYLRHFQVWHWISMPDLLAAVRSREYTTNPLLNYWCQLALFGPAQFEEAIRMVGEELECDLHSYINRRPRWQLVWRRRTRSVYVRFLQFALSPICGDNSL